MIDIYTFETNVLQLRSPNHQPTPRRVLSLPHSRDFISVRKDSHYNNIDSDSCRDREHECEEVRSRIQDQEYRDHERELYEWERDWELNDER